MNVACIMLACICVLVKSQQDGRHHRRSLRGVDVSAVAHHESNDSCGLGVLMIDGYYYPTQPGDIDDLRTWCTVLGPDPPLYKCSGEGDGDFGLVKSVVRGATWMTIQNAVKNATVRVAFRDAVEVLLRDQRVCGIVGQAGFFAFYQYFVEDIINELVVQYQNASSPLRRKPMLLGTPALARAFAPKVQNTEISGWGLTTAKQKVLIVTSHFDPLYNDVEHLLYGEDRVGPRNKSALQTWMQANSNRFISLGWSQMPGYGIPVVYGALFHNVFTTVQNYEDTMQRVLDNATANGEEIVAILLESTEMPAHSNNIRNFTGLPVWDVSTLGRCLVAAGPSSNYNESSISDALFSSQVFKHCMMAWYDEPLRFETRFGLQKNAKLKYYEDQDLLQEQLIELTCSGGRPEGASPIGRRVDDFDAGIGGSYPMPQACTLT